MRRAVLWLTLFGQASAAPCEQSKAAKAMFKEQLELADAGVCLTDLQQRAAPATLRGLNRALRKGRLDIAAVLLASVEPWVADHPVPDAARLRITLARDVEDRGLSARLATLRVLLDIDAGQSDGDLVTDRTIDDTEDQDKLALFARRLPDVDLRERAVRRLVDLRATTSEWPAALGERWPEARAAIMSVGRWELPVDAFSIRSVHARHIKEKPTLFFVHDVLSRQATLYSRGATIPVEGLNVGVLSFLVDGLPTPIIACEAQPRYLIAPCLGSDRVHMAEGDHAATSTMDSSSAMQLVINGMNVSAEVDEKPFEIALSVHPGPQRPIVLEGAPGDSGPALDVRLSPVGVNLLRVDIAVGNARWSTVIRSDQPGRFALVSAGGVGRGGQDGRPGLMGDAGRNGRDAMCPGSQGLDGGEGQDGQSGRPGGVGEPGGDGGDLRVTLLCGRDCDALHTFATGRITSMAGTGGAGGEGGRGGAGGAGGAGGRDAQCNVQGGASQLIRGGRTGISGHKGSDGGDGPSGPRGRPGKVLIIEAERLSTGALDTREPVVGQKPTAPQ